MLCVSGRTTRISDNSILSSAAGSRQLPTYLAGGAAGRGARLPTYLGRSQQDTPFENKLSLWRGTTHTAAGGEQEAIETIIDSWVSFCLLLGSTRSSRKSNRKIEVSSGKVSLER